MAQLPLSNLICIQPPEDSSSMPTNSVVELIFRPADVSAEDYCMTEDQRNWLSTVIYDNKFAFYTDSKENSASWAYALQVTQPEAGIRGFTMPGPDQDGLERVGTLLNIIPEEEEEGY